MKNVLLLILLFLNINSSDIDEKLWQNYGIIYGTTNPYFKIKLESENIRGDSHGLLKIRHRNLQKIVEAQTRFLNEIDSIITDTNKEKKKGFTLLKLCDFYFNASEKIPDNICRLKNKFNEFENKSKQYIDEKKQDEYIPKIKYNNNGVSWDKKIFIMKNQADEANEKCIKDDFWCNGEKITDEFINAEIECLFVKNRYDKNIYSTIKTDYYNNCHIIFTKICKLL